MGKPGLPAPAGSMLTKGDKTDSEAVPLGHNKPTEKESANYYMLLDGQDRTF
jgi:hypothetical protein